MTDAQRMAELLGVDEVRVVHGLNRSKVSVRLGDLWADIEIDYAKLEDAKNATDELGRIVFNLAEDLRQRYSIETARAEVLDQIAATAGITRRPGLPLPPTSTPPKPRRPLTRFEAIAEELKKL